MIQIELADRDHYKVEIVSSPDFEKDHRRVSDLPIKVAVWGEEEGEDVFKYWSVPRVDIGEIRRRWKSAEILGDDTFWRDVKTWRRVCAPIDPIKRYRGRISTGKIKSLYRRQKIYARTDLSRLRTLCPWNTGAGKTIAGLVRAKAQGHKKILIITIGAVFDDWVRDAKTIFGIQPTAYVGTPKQREKLRQNLSDIVVATYENAYELPVDWEHYILDEADMICNPETRRYQRLIPMLNATWKGRRGVQILTATFVGNTPSTAWALFKIIHPLIAGSQESFRMRFEKYLEIVERSVPIRKNGRVIWIKKRETKSLEFQNKKSFLQKMAAFVIQLPEEDMKMPFKEKISYIPVEMTDRQTRIYTDLRDKMKAQCGARRIKIKEARTAALRLQQASEGLFHFDEGGRLIKESGKLLYLVKLIRRQIKSGKTDKLVIWSRFVKLPEILHKVFGDYGVLWTGKLNHDQKRLAKWAFNGVRNKEELDQYRILQKKYNCKFEPGEAIFFFGVMAGSTGRGMNLDACARQIITSTSVSGRVMTQNLGRIRRSSQKHKLLYTYFLHSEGSVDMKWIKFAEKKTKDMGVTSQGIEKLTAQHLRELAACA